MIDFESLGYKDITKDKPISIKDWLGEFFEITGPYSKRFYKEEGIITIELKVGKWHNLCFILGTCYYPLGWEKFELCIPEDYIDKMFTQTINVVKLTNKVGETFAWIGYINFNPYNEI